jgi:hypothetical protein
MTLEVFHAIFVELHHRQKFPLGQVVITANALAIIPPAEVNAALARHASGDWGELCREDKSENERALNGEGRLFSAYAAKDGPRFWIITESDRSVTTVLLPADY